MKKSNHVELTFLLNLFLPIIIYIPFALSPINWTIEAGKLVFLLCMWGMMLGINAIRGKEYLEKLRGKKNVQTRTNR